MGRQREVRECLGERDVTLFKAGHMTTQTARVEACRIILRGPHDGDPLTFHERQSTISHSCDSAPKIALLVGLCLACMQNHARLCLLFRYVAGSYCVLAAL